MTLDAKRRLKGDQFGKQVSIATQVAYSRPHSFHCFSPRIYGVCSEKVGKMVFFGCSEFQ